MLLAKRDSAINKPGTISTSVRWGGIASLLVGIVLYSVVESLKAFGKLLKETRVLRTSATVIALLTILTLVAALMGTPYEIETNGKILFLEDIGEAPYRVDRMLSTMRLGGKLRGLAGVVLGTFTYRSDQDTSIEESSTVDQVLASYFDSLGVPVIRMFPAGHHRCNATLPFGVRCELDADAGTLRVLESPVQTVAE